MWNIQDSCRWLAKLPLSVCWLLAIPALATAQTHELFDAHGFSMKRDPLTELPYEHIDPLTGNLLLTMTDLVLPGNAGFELRIQRSYNSKVHKDFADYTPTEDSWAGIGWILHLGRVLDPGLAQPLIEMPDGSVHKTFAHVDGSGRRITRDYWLYEPTGGTCETGQVPLLRLPNGVTYTFCYSTTTNENRGVLYATLIQDPFGNKITVNYVKTISIAHDAIASIVQDLGSGQSRTVTFNTDTGTPGALRSMTYSASGKTFSWTYAHTTVGAACGNCTVMTGVTPPVGPSWQYRYKTTGSPPTWELTGLTTPNGGTVDYTYSDVLYYLGTSIPIRSRAVTQRVTGGRSISAGTWTYDYSQGSSNNQSVITTPCGTQTTQTFIGVGPAPPPAIWQTGLLQSKVLKEGSTTLEQQQFTWLGSALVSSNTDSIPGSPVTDAGIKVPLLQVRTTTRGSQAYTTTNSYNSTNLNDYGRPFQVQESGNISRTTTRTFRYGFTPYIVDKVATDTVTVSGQSFAKSWDYNLTTGFTTSETLYGVTTTFAPSARGNVASLTNANQKTTTFGYSWGVQSTITPPVAGTSTTRSINPEGTVASETRRGFTTNYQYDLLFRVTQRTPPAGSNATNITYNNSGGAWVSTTTSRGASSTVATLDGFGRTVSTSNNVGVQTAATFDACGRKTYESYPFQPTTFPNRGTTFAFDGLGRVTRKTNPDNSFARYVYSTSNGIDVEITDEQSHLTTQDFSGFGDPRDSRLVAVTDARGSRFAYSYNAVGSLTGVTVPSTVSGARSWVFNSKNQLDSETHPESGTTRYTYYPAGNVETKTDRFGTTRYTYDDNTRLTFIQRPAGYTSYNTTIGYDGSDNRDTLNNGYVSSTFGYDGANRLTSRTDVINGQSFVTGYTPDGNDNIQKIDYPSGNAVVYGYDAENRINLVRNGPNTTIYANAFSYHPSGGVLSFKPGGTGNPNPAQTFTFDGRYRLWTASTGQRSLTYGYDNVGNVTSIADARSGKSRSPIGYDEIDRLTSVSGFTSGSYSYDSLGNRTGSSVGGSMTYEYNSSTARLTSFTGSGTLGYDTNGNLTSDGPVRSYTYTPDNLLESVNPGVATYRYDGDGMRKLKIDNTADATRYYVHGPGSQILTEFEEACPGNRQFVRDYVYAGGRLLAALRPANPAVQVGFQFTGSSPNEATGSVGVGVRITTASGGATTCPVTVRFATANGTAIAGTDYTATTGTLQIPAGSPNGTVQGIPVTLTNDTLCRGNRTFTVGLSDATGATPAVGGTSHTVTIVDDDVTCITAGKSIGGDKTPDGGSVVYTVVMTNGGSQAQLDRPGHEFEDPISSNLTYLTSSATAGTTTYSGGTVYWNGSVPAGGAVTVTINARTNLGTAGLPINNTATIRFDRNNDGTNETTIYASATGQIGIGRTNYYTITPCRLVDTRNPNGPLGGPILTAGSPRTFQVTGNCGIPSTAKAISLNLTVVGPTAGGQVTLYPAFIPTPGTTTINYSAGQVRANNAVMTLNAGQLSAVAGQAAGTTTHILIDVNGYFQ